MSSNSPIRLAFCVLASLSAQSALAQASDLYVTSNLASATRLMVFRNGAVVQDTAVGTFENALAVTDDVRTYGSILGGAQYSLAGIATGVNYPNTIVENWSDGTTDGQYNYAASLGSKAIFRFDRNWANPTTIFTDSAAHSGITYDLGHNSLWTYANGSGIVVEHALTGEVLGSFPVANSRFVGALAYEPSSQTLWIALGTDVIRQYSRTGELLGSFASGVGDIYGLEFAMSTPSPAPGAFGLLGAAGLIGSRRRGR